MQLVQLVLFVCLSADPTQCKEARQSYPLESVLPMQIMMSAPAEVAKWASEHPQWVVKRWTAEHAGRYSKI